MKKTMKKQEFLDHRISWKFFDRLMNEMIDAENPPLSLRTPQMLMLRTMLEILKELQYQNDK